MSTMVLSAESTIENSLAVCCGCGAIGDREAFSNCPTCDKFICGMTGGCDCPCPVLDEEDAARQAHRMLTWRPILKPVRAIADLGLTAILLPVLWAARFAVAIRTGRAGD